MHQVIRWAWRRLSKVLRSGALDRDTDEEIRFHIDMEAGHLSGSNTSENALRIAMARFGSRLRIREEVRDAHGLRWLDDARADLRIALRGVGRAPGFHATLVFTLALGITLATVIFAAADALLLRPIPYASDRTVGVWGVRDDGRAASHVGARTWAAWQEMREPFEAIAAFEYVESSWISDEGAVSVPSARVSEEFFRVLPSPMTEGRGLTPADFVDARSVVVSHRFWRQQLRGDSHVVGRALQLDGASMTIVGVLPEDFGFPNRQVGLLTPLPRRAEGVALVVIAKLLQERFATQRYVNALAWSYSQRHPDRRVVRPELRPLGEHRVITDEKRALYLLLGVALAVLAIAGLNGAHLLLFRGLVRGREMATRLALGAATGRLVRLLVTESLVCSALTVAVALPGAFIGVRVLAAYLPGTYTWQSYHDLSFDLRAMMVLAMITLSLGLVVSLGTAWMTVRQHQQLYRAGQLSGRGGALRSHRGRRILVALELALSTALLIGAGLLIESLRRVKAVDEGVDVDRLATLAVSLDAARYPDSVSRIRFTERLVQELRLVPGVEAMTVSDGMPPYGRFRAGDSLYIGERVDAVTDLGRLNVVTADTAFFGVLGIRVAAGRTFAQGDETSAERPVVIDIDLANHLWPRATPLGRRLRLGGDELWSTVVGIVADAKLGGQDDRDRNFELYRPGKNGNGRSLVTIGLRSSGNPSDLLPQAREVVRELDPVMLIWRSSAVRDDFATELSRPRFLTGLVGWFAAVGLLLGIVGLYGVIALTVSQRTAEFGVRIALGATGGRIVSQVLVEALWPVGGGLILGLLLGGAIGGALTTLLYKTSPFYAPVFVGVPMVLLFSAVIASVVPARRAAREAPVDALRVE